MSKRNRTAIVVSPAPGPLARRVPPEPPRLLVFCVALQDTLTHTHPEAPELEMDRVERWARHHWPLPETVLLQMPRWAAKLVRDLFEDPIVER